MQNMKNGLEDGIKPCLLSDASIDSIVNEAFSNSMCIMTLEKHGDSRHYTTFVAPNYKIIFFIKQENCKH